MMQVRWIVKTTPEVKRVIADAIDWLAADGANQGQEVGRIAADLVAEIFDIKEEDA